MDGVIFRRVPVVVVFYDQLEFMRLVNDMIEVNVIFSFAEEMLVSLKPNGPETVRDDHMPF